MLNYFVYKNGQGNFFTPLTDRHSVFYVGFGERWMGGAFPAPTLVNQAGAALDKADDLDHVLFVSHEANRGRHCLLTFDKAVLRFWRVTGEVRLASEDEWALAATIPGRPASYEPYFKAGQVLTVPAKAGEPTPFRVLPVEEVAAVPRDAIYTSVDSLAVYQYLIRGTCRPLWRAGGPTAATHHPGVVAARQARIGGCERIGEETEFGAFVRLYLNELLHRSSPDGATTHPRLGEHAVDEVSATQMVMSTLNPILVETAALAFVQDLRLTPDIGVGKGKDVIDVRARAATEDGRLDQALARDALNRLHAIAQRMPDLRISQELQRNLLKRGVLDVQCKAADRNADVRGVLYFGFKGKGAVGADLLLLNDIDSLLANGEWPQLRRFLAMQARILRGEWPSAEQL